MKGKTNNWQRFKYEWRMFCTFMTISCLTEKERACLISALGKR